MLSERQIMNTSHDRLRLMNSYGAFGGVGRERYEIILQGTADVIPSESAAWLDYEFPGKPGDIYRRPALVAPYHYRLDWQIWFAAMSDINRQPWLVHLVYKLLEGDEACTRLLEKNPFQGKRPMHIRAEIYRYNFTSWEDDSDAWWKREPLGLYLPPVSLDHPTLLGYLRQFGWVE